MGNQDQGEKKQTWMPYEAVAYLANGGGITLRLRSHNKKHDKWFPLQL